MTKPALSIKEIRLSLPLGVAVRYAHAPTVSVSAVISRPILPDICQKEREECTEKNVN